MYYPRSRPSARERVMSIGDDYIPDKPTIADMLAEALRMVMDQYVPGFEMFNADIAQVQAALARYDASKGERK